tara:strand:- start:1957 stop:2571 length:615 start_codon:yes stop_codon:yes gene_type:complete
MSETTQEQAPEVQQTDVKLDSKPEVSGEGDSSGKNSNPMQEIRIEKITLNIGAGKDQKVLEKGLVLIKHITKTDGIQTVSNKRIPAWGVRPGLPVGAKLTIRGVKIKALLSRLLRANGNILKMKQFSEDGNFSFGIKEYIDIPDVEYEPTIGVMGLEVSVTLERPGFRIKKRRIRKSSLPSRHRIGKDEAIAYIKKNYGVEITE